MYRTNTCGEFRIIHVIILLFVLFTVACSKKERMTTIPVMFASFEEEYIPKGSVSSIETPSGNTIFMDEDSTFFLGDIVFTKEQEPKNISTIM